MYNRSRELIRKIRNLLLGRLKLVLPVATILMVLITATSLMVIAGPRSSFAFVVDNGGCGLVVEACRKPVDTSNLNPGDTKSSYLVAKNTKSTSLNYFLNMVKKGSTAGVYPNLAGKHLDEILEFTLERDGETLFQGTISEFQELNMGTLHGKESQQIDISVYFPTEAGNEFQASSVTVQFEFRSECGLEVWPATQGYWKTHSAYGPEPYDATWALIGEDTLFFSSSKSWYEVLWTSPAGGNAYYILANQYIAARLNILNGAASTPEVDAAIAWAEKFFDERSPSDRLSHTLRSEAIACAELLDQYNNGHFGPGPCSE